MCTRNRGGNRDEPTERPTLGYSIQLKIEFKLLFQKLNNLLHIDCGWFSACFCWWERCGWPSPFLSSLRNLCSHWWSRTFSTSWLASLSSPYLYARKRCGDLSSKNARALVAGVPTCLTRGWHRNRPISHLAITPNPVSHLTILGCSTEAKFLVNYLPLRPLLLVPV